MIGFIRNLWSRREGAAAVEFALVCVPLLVVTIGIMEFSFALYQWNAAEKATQFGVRMAVVSTPVQVETATAMASRKMRMASAP